jgi:hypothetical protein
MLFKWIFGIEPFRILAVFDIDSDPDIDIDGFPSIKSPYFNDIDF